MQDPGDNEGKRRHIERAIVATVLSDPQQLPRIEGKVQLSYFVDPLCKAIFSAQRDLYHLENVEPDAANILASGKLSYEDASQLIDLTMEEDRYNLALLAFRLCEMEADRKRIEAQRDAETKGDNFEKLSTLEAGITSERSVLEGAKRKEKREHINDVLARAHERA
jgi:hypothetical protein